MKKVIKLNNEISVDLPKLIEGGMVILANSGGGKSYLIRRIAEQAVENVQVIIIDPEGEFASLREKYDFILAGKNADVPAEPRSAALLATKLLEINKSAVIDLYELHPQERQRFVKLFCDALVNAPKELYHPVLIILDEAHEYVPEGKPSEATWSVELLASKGRKRGQRLILASQRIAKISKNVTAEANNKLIGRASQDIDMKRAGDELGFTKENLKQLRQLKPGEFFAFGPAISDEVVKLKVGEVQTAHAKVGYTGVGKVPPASEAIKKILGELKDLPQEAEKEAKTIAELKKENTELKRQKQKVVHDMTIPTRMIEEAVKTALVQKNKEIAAERNDFIKHIHILMKTIETIGREVSKVLETTRVTPKGMKLTDSKIETKTKFTLIEAKLPSKKEESFFLRDDGKIQSLQDPKKIIDIPKGSRDTMEIPSKQVFKPEPIVKIEPRTTRLAHKYVDEIPLTEDLNRTFGRCSKAIYSYLVDQQGRGLTKTQIAVATGYSQNSGGFNNSLSELSAAGMIERGHNLINLKGPVRQDILIEIDKSLEKWSDKLGACSKAIWDFLLTSDLMETYPSFSKQEIAQSTEYSETSGGFNNSLSELSALGLIERMPGGMIRINPEILDL